MITVTSVIENYTSTPNVTTLNGLQWTGSAILRQRPAFIICFFAIFTHSLFWIQVYLFPTYRQRTMQWFYVYVITDQLTIFRFLFSYTMHTSFYQTGSNVAWSSFICFTDATVDNYLNITTIYILLAINTCRYFQIVHNRNVYQKNPYLLLGTHLIIYSTPIIILVIQLLNGWAKLFVFPGDSCDIGYLTLAVQITNAIHGYILPIFLNVFVILLSFYHVHRRMRRRPTEIRMSAEDKCQRSLVRQFLLFYIIWLSFWSPDVLAYQFTAGESVWTGAASSLNYIGIALDPIIITALDVRIRRGWISMWYIIKRFKRHLPARIAPTATGQNEQNRF